MNELIEEIKRLTLENNKQKEEIKYLSREINCLSMNINFFKRKIKDYQQGKRSLSCDEHEGETYDA